MKAQLLMLSAAALLLTASATHARPGEFQRYSGLAQARADRLLLAAGVDPVTPVSVQATIAADGRVTEVRVLKSSGSADTDRAVQAVLRRVLLVDPPLGLLQGSVTLNVGKRAVAEASAR